MDSNAPRPAWARRSTPVGAALGAVCLIAAVLAGIWASGHVGAFAANRGLLQLVVIVPLVSLVTASGLTYFGILTVRHVFWTVVPVEALILLGTGFLEPGFTAWPWAVALSAVVFVPWIIGGLLGARLRGPDDRGDS